MYTFLVSIYAVGKELPTELLNKKDRLIETKNSESFCLLDGRSLFRYNGIHRRVVVYLAVAVRISVLCR